MSKKYRIGYLDEDEGYQAKFYQAFKNEFDIKILPIENINNVYDVLRFINDEELDALVVDYRLADSGQLTFNGDSVVDLINSMKEYVWVCHVEKNMVQNLSQKNKVSNIKSDVNGVELRIISKDKPVENATRENATLEDVFLYYFGEKAGVNNGTI